MSAETRHPDATHLVGLARQMHPDPSYARYALAYATLNATHELTGSPAFVTIDHSGAAPLRTFVMETGAGTPTLFVHGTPATSAVWTPLLAALGGVRAVAVDRPGHGLTDAFEYAQVTDLRAHAVDFLESVLDALGLERVVVVGSSMGGLWAFWLALDRPSRVSAVVQLGAPAGMLSDRLPAVFAPLSVPWIARAMRRLDPPSPASTRRLFRVMGDPPDQLSDAFVAAFTAAQRLPSVDAGVGRMIQRFVRLPGRLVDRRLWLDERELSQIRQPVLCVWGRRDFVGGLTLGRRVVGALPDARLVGLGTGHLPWLQETAAVAGAVERFIAEQRQP